MHAAVDGELAVDLHDRRRTHGATGIDDSEWGDQREQARVDLRGADPLAEVAVDHPARLNQ